MLCSGCGQEKRIAIKAKMLCSACYSRLRRNGDLQRRYVVNSGKCQVDGCEEPAFAKNYCALHYSRSQHPLKVVWKTLRSINKGMYPKAWDRFEKFLEDVGERPGDRHQLRRKDPTKAFSKTNVYWLEPLINDRADYYTPAERSAYIRDWTLKRKFGLSSKEYAAMLSEQDGKCGVCEGPEVFFNKKTQAIQELSVDHDHATEKVRGLLCVRCNRMLGYARDNPEILRKAAAYLEFHQSRFACEPS